MSLRIPYHIPLTAYVLCVLFSAILLVFSDSTAMAADNSFVYGQEQDAEDLSNNTQTKIQTLFNNLETIGSSYNGGGSNAASMAALDSGCHASVEMFLKTNLVNDLMLNAQDMPDLNFSGAEWVSNKIDGLSVQAKTAFCNMLKGEGLESVNWEQKIQSTVRDEIFPMLMMSGVGIANRSQIPFLTHLEIELGTSDNDLISSITTVQPLWQDKTNQHHVFSQLSYYKAPKELNDEGFRIKHDTINAGLAYRYLTSDQKHLYGANIFFDHAPKSNHNRMSLGVDARTSQFGVSANRYMPLSTWKSLDQYYEERAAAGWDLEFRGQTPELPSWTAILKGYQWDEQDDGKDLYGTTASIEYSPVPALAVRVGITDESQSDPSLEAALRFVYRFDQPEGLQWRQKTALTPVSELVYEKVHRENIIRTKVRRKASSKLTVTETTGANLAVETAKGSSSLFVGQTLLMPVTVTTANTLGAVARLRFAKGAILTLGQNTQVTIVPDLITLVTGTIQFVSDGVIKNIAVPGGTIELHGTDIDAVSNGVNSSVRVRDGSITLTGTASGSATIGAEEMAESIVGVVGTVAMGSPNYITHTDTVSNKIDWVATPQTGPKVSPYPYEAPRIVSENLTPGQTIVIGIRYNTEVVVSGGVPFMNIVINGNAGTAPLIAGSGTKDLSFAYTVQAADGGATTITISDIDINGSTIMGNGKNAVTTIADTVLTLSGAVADVTAPAGYAVAFSTSPVNIANVSAAGFDITTAEIGATYNYTISSSGGGTNVTGSGTISGATENITGLNLSGLNDGTLTVSVTLTDPSLNVGAAATNTATKDVVAPYISSITPPANATYAP
ncbi:MAG TPA: inverse autotransporter beta domain-containing protein [Alphaproteobacteria bacterium]|nr:inverse autotransporter beta domain-containing protein [Alphaproteobacteria bacterium]